LVKAGANVLLTNRNGNTALDDAKRVQATPVVEILEGVVAEVRRAVCFCLFYSPTRSACFCLC
jgi:hypothetical protein